MGAPVCVWGRRFRPLGLRSLSALSLLVLGILADDHYAAVSFDDLALFADLLNGWLNFHVYLPYLSCCECVFGFYFVRQVIRPFERS